MNETKTAAKLASLMGADSVAQELRRADIRNDSAAAFPKIARGHGSRSKKICNAEGCRGVTGHTQAPDSALKEWQKANPTANQS